MKQLLVVLVTPSSPLLIEIEIEGTWWPQREFDGGKCKVKLSKLRLLLLSQVEFIHLIMLNLVNK